MDKWQRSFVGKLEGVKRRLLDRFEQIAEEWITPAFQEFDHFTTGQGFTVSSPECDAGTRLYKFGLTENGYLLVAFRLHGMEQVEAHTEVIVPGAKPVDSETTCAHLTDLDGTWIEHQFRDALDRFVDAFVATSERELAATA